MVPRLRLRLKTARTHPAVPQFNYTECFRRAADNTHFEHLSRKSARIYRKATRNLIARLNPMNEESLRAALNEPFHAEVTASLEMRSTLFLAGELILAGRNGNCIQVIDCLRRNTKLFVLLLLGR